MDSITNRKAADYTLYESRLYRLLMAKLPSEFIRYDRLRTERISKATKNARYTVYRWLSLERLSPQAAISLLKLSNETEEAAKKGALTKEDLYPFLLNL